MRGRSASGYTAGTPGPLKAPSPLPTVAAEARDAARGGQTRPGGFGLRAAVGANADTDTDAKAATVADAAATRGGTDGSDVAGSDGTKTGSVNKQATMKSAKPTHGQEEKDSAYLRRKMCLLEREVSRLRETVERLTKERAEKGADSPNNASEGQKGGDHLYEEDERKCPRDPTGAIMGPPPPPSPHPWPASRRSRCPDGLGSSANNKEADKFRFGVPGPPDPLEDIMILFLRKLVEWWREIKPGERPPPGYGCCRRHRNRASMIAGGQRHLVVDRGAVGRQGRIHHRHGGGKGRARRKNGKPAAQALPTIHAPTEGARTEGLVSSSLPSSMLRKGVSAHVATAGSGGSGIRIRTFAEVAARPPVRRRTGRESIRGAGGVTERGLSRKGRDVPPVGGTRAWRKYPAFPEAQDVPRYRSP